MVSKATLLQTGQRMSADDYLALPESHQHIEHIKGAIHVSPRPTDKHQMLIDNLKTLIKGVMPSGLVRSEINLYLDGDWCEPDVMWVSGPDSPCNLGDDGKWYGPPELICEVLSTDRKHDTETKFELYRRAGVPEYWLVDQYAETMRAYALRDGEYQEIAQAGGRFSSPVLDATIMVSAIFESDVYWK